jgi:hypothetical protein
MGTWNSSVFDDYLWIFASGGAATVNLLGTGALPNVRMHATSGTSTRGAVGAVNQNGLALAYMEVATDGTGRIVANVKNFRVDNPRDPATEICYASVEGPEAAVYVRGTARLEGGRATIDLPAHFQDVASEKGMTVELTPRSASSLGLAAIERSPSRLVVKELRRGQGDYDFDWLVKAVRRGHEDFRVVRPRSDDERASAWTPPEPTDAALRQQRSAATKEADDERH